MNKKIATLVIVLSIVGIICVAVISRKNKILQAALNADKPKDTIPNFSTGGIIPNSQANGTLPNYGEIPSTANNVATGALSALTVKLIQAASNLKVDGVNGRKTQAAISALAAKGVNVQAEKDILTHLLSHQDKVNFRLAKGYKNNFVKALQLCLGITADGNFGSGTEAALYKATGKTVCTYDMLLSLFSSISGTNITIAGTPVKRIWENQPWNNTTPVPSPLKPPSLATPQYHQFGVNTSIFKPLF